MEVRRKHATAPTATYAAVQVPCSDTALSPIEKLRMAEPVTKTQSDYTRSAQSEKNNGSSGCILTQEKDHPKHYSSDPTEHDSSGVINTIDFRMASLKATDDVVGLQR